MKNLMSITEKEKTIFRAFKDSEYGEGDRDSVVWMFSIKEHSGLKGKEFSGVVSSLCKKDLLDTDVVGDSTSNIPIKDTYTMWLTEDGKDVFDSLFGEEDDDAVENSEGDNLELVDLAIADDKNSVEEVYEIFYRKIHEIYQVVRVEKSVIIEDLGLEVKSFGDPDNPEEWVDGVEYGDWSPSEEQAMEYVRMVVEYEKSELAEMVKELRKSSDEMLEAIRGLGQLI